MRIQEINLDEQYFNLVKDSDILFLKIEWLKLWEENLTLYGVFDNGNNLVSSFFLYKTRLFGFSYFKNPPFTKNCGFFISLKTNNSSKYNSQLKDIIDTIAIFFNSFKFPIIFFPLPDTLKDTQPFLWNKFKVSPIYTYIIDLDNSNEKIKANFSSNLKSDISKAVKDNIIIKLNYDYNIVKDLVNKTFSRQSMTINNDNLNKLLFKYANRTNSYSFVAYKGDKPISATFVVYDKTTAYYLLSGYDSAEKHRGAGPLALHNSILHAKNLDLKYFDFEGSFQPKIEHYFRGFGGELALSLSVNKAFLPLEFILKFFKRYIF